jgi:hypothetical protein
MRLHAEASKFKGESVQEWSKTLHATGFSQYACKSAQKLVRGAMSSSECEVRSSVVKCQNFSAVQEHRSPENHLLFAIVFGFSLL